jgi:hypothetical protein
MIIFTTFFEHVTAKRFHQAKRLKEFHEFFELYYDTFCL